MCIINLIKCIVTINYPIALNAHAAYFSQEFKNYKQQNVQAKKRTINVDAEFFSLDTQTQYTLIGTHK